VRGAFVVVLVSSCSVITDLGDLSGGNVDAGGDASGGLAVRCKGTSACGAPSICCAVCVDDDAGGCPFTFSCMSPTANCTGVTIGCSDPSSCPGNQICCALVGPNNQYLVSTSCKTSAECTASKPSVVLCDPNGPNTCPDGGQCKVGSSGSFADLYECQ
jgi:hypothetical protein